MLNLIAQIDSFYRQANEKRTFKDYIVTWTNIYGQQCRHHTKSQDERHASHDVKYQHGGDVFKHVDSIEEVIQENGKWIPKPKPFAGSKVPIIEGSNIDFIEYGFETVPSNGDIKDFNVAHSKALDLLKSRPGTVLLNDEEGNWWIGKIDKMSNLISQIDFFFKAASDSLFKELSSLETFEDRVAFAEKHFEHLSSGSSRVIYTIGTGKDKIVLKLAKNNRGIAQNHSESDPKMKCKFINETIDSDKDGYWKTSPFRDKVTEKEFEELTDIPFKLFGEAIGFALSDKKKPKDFDKVKDLELFKELIKVAKKAKLMGGDLIRISSWGKTDGHPLLLDAGLTENVYNEFYTSSSSISNRIKSLGQNKKAMYKDQAYSDNFGEWRVGDIIDYAKKHLSLQSFNIQHLAKIAFEPSSQEDYDETPGSPAFINRAEKSDLQFPIIVIKYPDGDFIADGNHRLWKARSKGLTSIKGYGMTADELHKKIKIK